MGILSIALLDPSDERGNLTDLPGYCFQMVYLLKMGIARYHNQIVL